MREQRRRRVNVVNSGPKDYSEEYKGRVITIPKGESIVMSRSEAVNFRGIRPEGKVIKSLVIEEIPVEVAEPTKPEPKEFISNVDGRKFNSAKELEEYDKQFEDKKIKED